MLLSAAQVFRSGSKNCITRDLLQETKNSKWRHLPSLLLQPAHMHSWQGQYTKSRRLLRARQVASAWAYTCVRACVAECSVWKWHDFARRSMFFGLCVFNFSGSQCGAVHFVGALLAFGFPNVPAKWQGLPFVGPRLSTPSFYKPLVTAWVRLAILPPQKIGWLKYVRCEGQTSSEAIDHKVASQHTVIWKMFKTGHPFRFSVK